MSRKLYALFIFIGAIGSLILVYLYFFVFYTATLTINTNVAGYKVELFSKSTAQKWIYNCPEKICIIRDVSPFDYNISISKEDYETKIIAAKVSPRRREEIRVQLEKKTILTTLEAIKTQETPKQKIQRLRQEKLYFARFELWDNTMITFSRENNQLKMQYRNLDFIREIMTFPLVKSEEIGVEYIGETKKIFLRIGKNYYIFDTLWAKIYELPFEMRVSYIKPSKKDFQYLVITEKGVFLYDLIDKKSEFQYLFKDFIYYDDAIIGVIYKDEKQKKSNFNLTKKGNLIIKYSPKDKQRKILLGTSLPIDRIEKIWEKVIFSANGKQYELENF